MSTVRTLRHVIPSIATADGAGVKLRRSIGSQRGLYVDPFLMLDEFYSDNPDDYIAGFPPHPHRGFETVTYMLDGHMQHQDHLGNTGDLGPGSVQWMTAARGIIHSEMPQQTEGRMRGFQLWLNLPSTEKMKPASYRDIPASEVPAVPLASGAEVRVIAGTLQADGRSVDGPISPASAPLTTAPLYFDVRLPAGVSFTHALPPQLGGFAYVYEGEATIAGKPLPNRAAGVLDGGDEVRIDAGPNGARFLLLAARPISEPVVQYGPFVMNTREEIEQAIQDYQSGAFARAA
ncbi:pirin family protein [Solimonas flava]|uniref:pirin family protein n=1 Tax=Solimonas flava TaxID=415849 RepID=UPI0003F8AF19|nr:pirin family protein [Solimonas flava]